MINTIPVAVLVVVGLLAGGSIFLLLWNKPVLVIYIQFGYCCFMRWLISDLHFPVVIKYLSDFLTIVLFLQVILKFNTTKNINVRKPMIFIILFIILGIFSTAFNSASLLFYIWGARVYLRFYVFFLACVIFLKREDIDKLVNFLLKLLPVNTVVSLFQYKVMGYEDDYVGGLFGSEKGCNAEMTLYLTLITIILVVFYLTKKTDLWYTLINILMIMLISAISELKILFIILFLVVLISFFIMFPNRRAVTILIVSSVVIVVSFIFFLILYPNWVEMYSTSLGIYEHSVGGNYAGVGSLGRFTAGSYIFQNLLTETSQKLFGIGFGNADKFLTFSSQYYRRYEVLQYDLFAYSLILIEIGVIGLVIYCFFFVITSYESVRIRKKINIDHSWYCYVCFIVSVIVFVLLVYNQAMQMDAAFLIFFPISFPFILEKENYEAGININTGVTYG